MRALALRLLFGTILVTMIGVTSWASLRQPVWQWGGLTQAPDNGWAIATLCDAYFGFVTFYVWLAYKERRWLTAHRLARRHPAARQHGDAGVRAAATSAPSQGPAHGRAPDRPSWLVSCGAGSWTRRSSCFGRASRPRKSRLSLAFGLGIGIFPVLGVSTVLCTVVAIALRLNLPAIQLVNYLASPLQLALIIPFVRVGEHLLGLQAQPLSIAEGFRIMAARRSARDRGAVGCDRARRAGLDRHRARADLRALLRLQATPRSAPSAPADHGRRSLVIGNPWLLLLIGTLVVVAIMFGLWWLGVRTHNFSYVDIGWSVNFAVLAVLYAWLAPGDLSRRVIIAAMFTAHGLRLGWHLSQRIIGEPEEGRYQQLRKDWGGSGNFNLKFLGFFEFQAVLNAFLTLPLLIACFNATPRYPRARNRGPRTVPRRPHR